MKTLNWRIGRIQYSVMLGVLTAISVKLHSPGSVIVGYALFAALTALRFAALRWNVARAFIPVVIVIGGTLLGSVFGPAFAALAHGVALSAQVVMSVGAAWTYGPEDPVSPKHALARNLRAKRRLALAAAKETKSHRELLQRELAALAAIRAEWQSSGAIRDGLSSQREAIDRRLAHQMEVVKPLRERMESLTEHLQGRTAELRAATQAWKDRNKREAA